MIKYFNWLLFSNDHIISQLPTVSIYCRLFIINDGGSLLDRLIFFDDLILQIVSHDRLIEGEMIVTQQHETFTHVERHHQGRNIKWKAERRRRRMVGKQRNM